MEDLMAMTRKKARDAKSLKIQRVFESSRLADELMASAYENLVPIRRQGLSTMPQIKPSGKLWRQISMEKRQCAIGM
jgi:hypothetical protein